MNELIIIGLVILTQSEIEAQMLEINVNSVVNEFIVIIVIQYSILFIYLK